jgi:MoaA/NifB/PqqE/SkfB family radical SAM enzyme
MRLLSLGRDLLRNRSGAVTRPRFLTYIVTFACNARCIMCDSWRKDSPDELTLGEIAGIFDQLPRMDAVRLSGGEPFVRGDLPEIARLAEERLRPLALHVTTNGFLTRRIVGFCEQRRRARPLHLLVSLDGVGAAHNQVRGRDTAWQTAFATVQALAPRQRELNLRLAVNQTIVSAEGLRNYRELRAVLQPLGVRLNVVMAYDVSATYGLGEDRDVAPKRAGEFGAFARLAPDMARELLDELERDTATQPLLERWARRYYLRGIRNRLLRAEGSPNPPCVALRSHLRLYPNGDVPTCQFNGRRVGNLRRQRFEEVWSGVLIDQQRQWVRQCPGCWAECEVIPNAVYTGDWLRWDSGRPQPGWPGPAQPGNEQMYSQRPPSTSISKPDLGGTSKSSPAVKEAASD